MSRAYGTARRKLSNSLSSAARRKWMVRLATAQEEVENAILKRDQLFAEAYEAGMAYAAIESATGLGPTTVRNAVDAHTRGTEEDREGSS